MSDLDQLKAEYQRRAKSGEDQKYSILNRPGLFAAQQRQRQVVHLLNKHNLANLGTQKVLEVGCGSGSILLDFLRLEAQQAGLFGIDILPYRLQEAQDRLPRAGLGCADGRHLPFADHTFDLILQFTAISSILDETIQQQVAGDMLRVLKKDGAVLWYDFWLNPVNNQTMGLTKKKIRHLFPNCQIDFQRITLAPPIARRLIPYSWGLPTILERLKFLNTHFLCLITK